MKTMTCKQMGGPCNEELHGNTAEEIMDAGGKHVKEKAAQGDEEHQKVQAMMDKGPEDPDNKEWMEKFMATFTALPEN